VSSKRGAARVVSEDQGAGRTVTSKALAILEAFESGLPSLSLSQIADAAGLPLPTAHRLVGELVGWGALERDGTGRYCVGLRLWEVGQNAGRQLRDTHGCTCRTCSR
jgi:DNA-binding IclR family transcriptional regulator